MLNLRSALRLGRRYANPVLAILVAVAIVLLVVRFFLAPLYFVFWPDSWSYVEPAMSALSGGPFNLISGRTFGYPLFVYGVLRIWESFAALIYVQLVLYLVLLALFHASWNLFRSTLTDSGVLWLHRFLGLAMLLSFLCLASLQFYVNAAMPEILYATLTMLQLYLVSLALMRPLSPAALVALVVIGSLLGALIYMVKPHWAAAMLFAGAALWMRLWTDRRTATGWKIVAPLGVVAIAWLAIFSPQRQLALTYDPWVSRVFAPKTLFCNHADLVVTLLDDPGYVEGHQRATLLADVRERLRRVVQMGPRGWPLLGLDGDQCTYNGALSETINLELERDPVVVSGFYRDLFIDAVLADPVGYAGKVSRQLGAAIADPGLRRYNMPIVVDTKTIDAMRGHLPAYDRLMDERTFGLGEYQSLLADGVWPLRHPSIWMLRRFNDLAWVLWALTLGVVSWRLIRSRGERVATFTRALPVLLTCGLYLSSLSVVAIAHSFDVGRYLTVLTPLALLSLGACIMWLADSAAGTWRRRASRGRTSALVR